VIIEVALHYTEYRGWGWSPGGAAIDFSKDAIRAQLKTTRAASPSYNTFLSKLIDTGKAEGATQFVFDVRKLPGLDLSATEAALKTHIQLNHALDADNIILKFLDYEFVP
jgi:hypothetical protein